MNVCRCSHSESRHRDGAERRCVECGCPEYRAAETADTVTLRGTEGL